LKYVDKKFVSRTDHSAEDLSLQLYYACKTNRPIEVLRLCQQKANVNFQNDSEGRKTCLHIAVIEGHVPIAVLLVQNR